MQNYNGHILGFTFSTKFKLTHFYLLVLSFICLGSAYFVEHVLKHTPCPLCVYQRIPYFIIICVSLIGLIYNKKSRAILFLSLLAIISNIILSTYHVGVERKIFKPTAKCEASISINKNMSLKEFESSLIKQDIASCAHPDFFILGLSMAEWNLILNIILASYLIFLFLKL